MFLENRKNATGQDLRNFLGISRQAINKHLKEMIGNGLVLKKGKTRKAFYSLHDGKKSIPTVKIINRNYCLQGLEEDSVFRDFALILQLKKYLSGQAFEIIQYAFTEILNNAIEHSNSKTGNIKLIVNQYNLHFQIRDFGIGIFCSILKKFKLLDENAAIMELLKGKTTTMKQKHTGEGIFFTSKIADTLSLRSHKFNLIFDNRKKDIFIEKKVFQKGTQVNFVISKQSRRRLNKIFLSFAPEEFDYKFDRTVVMIKLLSQEYISRSEAKRLLSGLDKKFKEIILDFKGVKSIGQGFADEVFRIFRKRHPEILIKSENASLPVKLMIDHVVDN